MERGGPRKCFTRSNNMPTSRSSHSHNISELQPVRVKRCYLLTLTFSITSDFVPPICSISLRPPIAPLAVVTMPKTSMNEDHFATTREYKVWLPWKVLIVKPISVASCVQNSTNCQLRSSILRLDRSHCAATAVGYTVCHALRIAVGWEICWIAPLRWIVVVRTMS